MAKATLPDEDLLARAGVTFPPGAKVTPMLRQWLQAKAKAPDAVLLFRMGDFYELFSTDAENIAPVLELTLTTRDKDKDSAISMAGFPHHAAPAYIAKLIAAGYKVAVCDQLEDPALAKGIVKRDVTRVVTPGMTFEEESLEAGANNWLVSVAKTDSAGSWGLAALDLSTGAFRIAAVDKDATLLDEVGRLAPRELVALDDGTISEALFVRLGGGPAEAARRVERQAPVKSRRSPLSALGPRGKNSWLDDPEHRPARRAAEQVIRYVVDTQGGLPGHVEAPAPYAVEGQLLLDATTRRHLDLSGPPGDRRAPGTLLATVDRTRTAPGGRRLLSMLLAPSTEPDVIEARLDAVQALVEDPDARARIGEALGSFYDLERLTARVSAGRASPRDLGRLRTSLERLPLLEGALRGSGAASLIALADDFDTLPEVNDRLSAALTDDPPLALGQGPVFRDGFDPQLDELSSMSTGGRDAIVAVEAREREATGIANLKVKYTRVFGYYLEVTRTHLAKVPDHYKRKQTVANAERYVTDELARLEEQLASAQTRCAEREVELFTALRSELAEHGARLIAAARRVAEVDALRSFAEVSDENRYVRPTLLPGGARTLRLRDARHPVVEVALRAEGEPFVPSSVELTGDGRQVLLVTGPNMAGKSTLMRQIALVQLLAQAGCFVPAAEAELSICDRIFTRVGASDDIASGRSTFMVEMTETAHILRHATPRSLVLLDEIGRGTSTFDGVSIAWSVAEHLHDQVGARTLFATHYHELCELERDLERLSNVHVVVKEWNDEIVFVRTLADGGAERSYGIQVARLAGLPATVLARAKEVLAALEGDPAPPSSNRHTPTARHASKRTRPQMDLFGARAAAADAEPAQARVPSAELVDALAGLDLNRMTPLDAMNQLAKLVDDARRLKE
jgi:DNA mismatch repair protein MutS